METKITCCTAAAKIKSEACRKRFECQKFKNFLNKAVTGDLKKEDMDAYYKSNYQFKPERVDKKACDNFEVKTL